jgi:hypothetical protein
MMHPLLIRPYENIQDIVAELSFIRNGVRR